MSTPDDLLVARLVAHEGIRLYAYKDTKDYCTIGVGRCIEPHIGKGLTEDEAFFLLRNDIQDFRNQLTKYPWFIAQDKVRQDALIELAFNMGLSHLLDFKMMIAALTNKQYMLAGEELLDSLWSRQVGMKRANDLARRLQTGKYP